MRDADAFDGVAYLGLSRGSKRDPYRLGLFARHLEPEECPLVLLSVRGGTLIVTDQRVLEFRPHLDAHGAWNVQQFQGYTVPRAFDRTAVRRVVHRVGLAPAGAQAIEDVVELGLVDATVKVLVSRGPQATLPEEDFLLLRDAILGQPK